jgi:oxygen-independent coproporphyrinogen-3 oxidase
MTLSLYIHIPWCLHKCSYCDFYSLPAAADAVPGAAYVERVIEELNSPLPKGEGAGQLNFPLSPALPRGGRGLHSIFLGGGTPSMIPPKELGRLLDAIAQRFTMPQEITIEANPETLDEKILRELRTVGFTRLSCGVQSFDPRQLQFLERVHSAEKAREALRAAKHAGFENRNLDLIYTLPDQSIADLENDLREAIALDPTHISAYQLVVEPGTPLERRINSPLPLGEGQGEGEVTMNSPSPQPSPYGGGRIVLPDEETAIAMWYRVREILADAGYRAYEISNFAQPGFECAHNIHYWKCGDYWGIGAGAVSRIGHHRWRRARNTKAYMAGEWLADQEEHLTAEQLRTEVCMLGLRMSDGIDLAEFETRFGRSWEATHPGKMSEWVEKGWATSDSHLRLTPSGMLILDTLAAELV